MAVVAIAVALVTSVGSCSSNAPASSSTTQASSRHLDASDFSAALKTPGTVVLDVRTPGEYASGHLPQAKNVDIEAGDFAAQIAALDKTTTYAVYCRSGNRSGVALEQMTTAGFSNVYDLADGIIAWQSMGGPVTVSGP
jgi:rhodanese-related sulfurtransferase